MNKIDINRRINIILRNCGSYAPIAYRFDGERLQTFREGRFNISKLTADWGATVFCISQDGKVMYFSGDPHQERYVAGEWQQWLEYKARELLH